MKPRLRQRFGLFVKTKRGTRSFDAYGKHIGRSGSTVHRLETGCQNFTSDLLEDFLLHYKCDVADLFPSLPYTGDPTSPRDLDR